MKQDDYTKYLKLIDEVTNTVLECPYCSVSTCLAALKFFDKEVNEVSMMKE